MAGIEKLSAVTSTCSSSGRIESDLLDELPHFIPVGTRRFSSSNAQNLEFPREIAFYCRGTLYRLR